MTDPPALGYYWGDDGYGIDRAADALGERIAAATGAPLERWRILASATDAAVIAARVATAPLFGGGTLAVVVEPGPLVRSREAREALVAVLGQVAPGNALAFLDPTDGSAKKTAALTALREAVAAAGGEVRELKAPRQGQMARWIEDRARERGVRLGRGSAQELAERVGAFVREGDIDRRRMGQLAVSELEKLALYRADGEVSPDHVRELVAEAVPASTWAFLDAVGLRRSGEAARLLDRLLGSTPEPVLIAQLHRRIRELIEIADRLDAGESLQAIARAMKLKGFRAEVLEKQAAAWSLPELDAALDGLADLDARVKGADYATEAQRRLAFVLWVRDRVARR
jgi:DNA polymerase-3 subunit delta